MRQLTIFDTTLATIWIAFYEKQTILLLKNSHRDTLLSYTRDFCKNKLILFDYKFYEKQTTIKRINLHVWKRASQHFKENRLYCLKKKLITAWKRVDYIVLKKNKYNINKYC